MSFMPGLDVMTKLPAMDDREAAMRVGEMLAANYRHKRDVAAGIAETDFHLVESIAEFLFCAGAVNYPFLQRAREFAEVAR